MISVGGIFIFIVSSTSAIGLDHTLGQILAPLRRPYLLLSTLFANFLVLPLGALVLALGLRLEEAPAEGLILLGIASGAPFVPQLTKLARGNLQVAVSTMGLLTAGTIIYMPLVLPLLVPEMTVSPLTVARPLLLFVILPLAFGLVTRAYRQDVATWLKPILDRISNASLLPVVILVVSLNVDKVVHVFRTGGILAGLLLLLLGLFVGWLLGGPADDTRRALALVTGVRNFAVAIVASQGFADPGVEIMVIVTAIIALLIVMPLSVLWGRLPLAN